MKSTRYRDYQQLVPGDTGAASTPAVVALTGADHVLRYLSATVRQVPQARDPLKAD